MKIRKLLSSARLAFGSALKVDRFAPAATSTRLSASSRACAIVAQNAPLPTLTPITSDYKPAAPMIARPVSRLARMISAG